MVQRVKRMVGASNKKKKGDGEPRERQLLATSRQATLSTMTTCRQMARNYAPRLVSSLNWAVIKDQMLRMAQFSE